MALPLFHEFLHLMRRHRVAANWLAVTNAVGREVLTVKAGTGSPEGVVVARVGSLFLRLDGGASTTLYVKTSGGAVAAAGSLNGITIANGNTVTLGFPGETRVYTFRTAISAAYDVLVGATDSDSLDNLIAAINGAAGAGSTYGTGTVAHPDVVAAAGIGDTMDVTAAIAGAAGNSIISTSTLTSGSFGGATLSGGSDEVSTGWTAK